MTDTAAPDATPSPSWGGPETEERVEALLGHLRSPLLPHVVSTVDEHPARPTRRVVDRSCGGRLQDADQDVDDFNKGFDNAILLAGMKANTMQSSIADPMNHWMICMNEIAASQGIPVRLDF